MKIMGSILRNNRRMFLEILNRIIGRKNWDRPKRSAASVFLFYRARPSSFAPAMHAWEKGSRV